MNRFVAEVLGTFALIFTGTCAIVANEIAGGSVTHVGISLTFGLVVLAIIYAIGDVSGAHINPAVTFGFWVDRRISNATVVPYLLAQSVGAVAASVLLHGLFPSSTTLGETMPSGSLMQSFLLEIVLTWFLMFVVLCVSSGAKEKGIMAGVAVGATVALSALYAGPISGASLNPARSLAPALALGLCRGQWEPLIQTQWIYVAGPLLGATIAVATFRLVQTPESPFDRQP